MLIMQEFFRERTNVFGHFFFGAVTKWIGAFFFRSSVERRLAGRGFRALGNLLLAGQYKRSAYRKPHQQEDHHDG